LPEQQEMRVLGEYVEHRLFRRDTGVARDRCPDTHQAQ
jgi:hypothetical protein